MPYPEPRELGDDLCLDCPKWDREQGRPRPELGVRDKALVDLLRDTRATGMLPHAGGLLDQDPLLMDLLASIASSSWFQEMTRAWE